MRLGLPASMWGRVMNCRETRPLLPLFFDGELEARQMRGVALHSTRCAECEAELRRLERVQEFVVSNVSAVVDEIDVMQVWRGIAPRLEAMPRPWHHRLREWWYAADAGWLARAPGYAVLAAAVVLALVIWQRNAGDTEREVAADEEHAVKAVAVLENPGQRRVERISRRIDNSAVVDSMRSGVGSLAVLTEPETNTMVLWIDDLEMLR